VNPPTTTVGRYRALVEHHSKNAIVDFNHNPSGTVPEEIPGLAKEGPLAFKIFMVKDTGRDYPHMPGIGINNNGELFKCFETVGQSGLPLMVHPHDQDLMDEIEGRYWKREDRSPQAYAKAYRDYDGIIWDTAMSTLFRMQKALGARLHILHMTTPEGLAMLRRAKDEGRPCSCEVNPWAMFLGTWENVEKLGPYCLGFWVPPAHVDALWKGINDGTVDIIGTDRNRFEGFRPESGQFYNQSWFAHEKSGWLGDEYPVMKTAGYQAPPLDGIWATAPYLHDGRAPSLRDAILAHGGEATPAQANFARLTPDEQEKVVDFLRTLGRDPARRGSEG